MTTAILLAAGRSERFGQDKPTFPFGDESLIQRTLRQATQAGIHRFVIVANLDNLDLIREQADQVAAGQYEIAVQHGRAADASVLEGLAVALAGGCDDVLLCCTNDIVPDDTISRLMAVPAGERSLTAVTATLQWSFHGGMLDLDGDQIRGIIEKPAGGCPPGAAVNIFLHRWRGRDVIDALADVLADSGQYEQTITTLLDEGLDARAIRVDRWVGVKDPADVQRALALFPDRMAVNQT